MCKWFVDIERPDGLGECCCPVPIWAEDHDTRRNRTDPSDKCIKFEQAEGDEE